MDPKRKAVLATVLVTVWVGLALWQWGALEEPVRVPLTNVTGHASSGQLTKAKT
ncbi:MAG: hypothetical protein HY038_12185, partial [Nitrospirae bacterium]|nr:hypothetical protein [Nitrospirota bacterium]